MAGADGRRVVVDLQAIQSVDQRHRGIPRYVADLAAATEAIAPDAVGNYAFNPDLALPDLAITERLIAGGKLARSTDVDWASTGLWHSGSPMEMSVPVHRLLPPEVRATGVPWVVTFYDLIPHLMPDYYLEDPGLRRRYRARLQLVRTATAVLTLSEASRADLVRHLGLDPERVFVAGAGTSGRFVPPASRAGAASAAAAAVPGLRPPYVFFVGSYEKRKNLEPLLEAWALLPAAVRGRWQLALCCALRPLERNHLLHRAAQLGVGDSVCLTGFVTDETLLLLHQGSDLFVFPSLYEGYGLPVAEALACGAPVLAADASSLPEIVGPEALFDPTSPAAMAGAIERGLTDEALRARLLAAAGRAPTTWTEVAEATLSVYDTVLSGALPPPGGTPPPRPASVSAIARRIAFVGPAGPGAGAVGDWNLRLVEALAAAPDIDVTVFTDRASRLAAVRSRPGSANGRHGGVRVRPLGALEPIERLEGEFDTVVYSVADDEHHSGSLAALRRRGDGIVVAHDVVLAGLYEHAARTGALPDGLAATIRSAYGDAAHPTAGAHDTLPEAEARRLGLLFCRDVLAHCRRLLVTSPAHATLADLDAVPEDRPKIHLAGPDPETTAAAIAASRQIARA